MTPTMANAVTAEAAPVSRRERRAGWGFGLRLSGDAVFRLFSKWGTPVDF